MVQRVKPCEGDELELVPHLCQLPLETLNLTTAEILVPVERWATIVSQPLTRIHVVDTVSELPRLVQARRACLAPQDVSIRCVCTTSHDRMLDPLFYPIEALRSTFSRHELMISRIHIVRQELRSLSIRPSNQYRWNIHHIRRKTSRDECTDKLSRWNQYLTTQMSTFLLASKLVLIVDRSGSGLDHSLHQFERVKGPTKSGLCIRNYRCKPINVPFSLHMLYLVRSLQCSVDPSDKFRDTIGRIETEVLIRLSS